MFGRRKHARRGTGGSWTLATGSYEGTPIVVRFDASYRGDRPRQQALPFRLGVVVPFDDRLQPSDSATLARIEGRVATTMEARGGQLVAVITQPTFREFVLYAPTADWASEAHESVQRGFPSHSIQMHAAEDATWSVYSSLSNA